MSIHEEDVLGKAYDAVLMRRLLGYLRPYRAQVAVALSALLPAAHDDDWFERQKFLGAFERLSGGRGSIDEIFALIDREFTEFAPVLKLATPGKSLVQHLVEEVPA